MALLDGVRAVCGRLARHGWADLLASLPVQQLKVLRVFRLVRVFRLLRANGAPTDMAHALYAYNPSRRYVRAVSAYAGQLRANPRAFLGYYYWQVFYGDTLLPEGYPARPATPDPG